MLWFAWKIVLLQYRKQQHSSQEKSRQVVICLKNRTFAVSQTTKNTRVIFLEKLWFAWKIVLLQYRKQLVQTCSRVNRVVICLKNRTFAVSQTTLMRVQFVSVSLWFAWKIVLLQYRKQLVKSEFSCLLGCDLLEKSYFCSIANNNDVDEFQH